MWPAGDSGAARPTRTHNPDPNWHLIRSMPDRARIAAILLAAVILLQVGLSTAEGGVSALTGRRPLGRALSFARTAPGRYALTLFGHDYRWSERLAGLGLEARSPDDPGSGLILFLPGREPSERGGGWFISGRVALGSVQGWRAVIAGFLKALRRLVGHPAGPAPGPALPGFPPPVYNLTVGSCSIPRERDFLYVRGPSRHPG